MSNELPYPPTKIWLQWHGDGDPSNGDPVPTAEVTWSAEKFWRGDVEYVRADLAARDKARLDWLDKHANDWEEYIHGAKSDGAWHKIQGSGQSRSWLEVNSIRKAIDHAISVLPNVVMSDAPSSSRSP